SPGPPTADRPAAHPVSAAARGSWSRSPFRWARHTRSPAPPRAGSAAPARAGPGRPARSGIGLRAPGVAVVRRTRPVVAGTPAVAARGAARGTPAVAGRAGMPAARAVADTKAGVVAPAPVAAAGTPAAAARVVAWTGAAASGSSQTHRMGAG